MIDRIQNKHTPHHSPCSPTSHRPSNILHRKRSRDPSRTEHITQALNTMACGYLKYKVTYRCGCTYRDRGRIRCACGRTKDATGRRTYCPDAKDTITRFHHHEHCRKPMHQRLQFDDRVWKCCECDLDSQIRIQCDNCNHPCCQYCSQERLCQT
jgi:hypothetical protein